MIHGSACAKVIVCGEHAVVYGAPAIAVPLPHLRVAVTLAPGAPGSGPAFRSPQAAPDDLAAMFGPWLRQVAATFGTSADVCCTIESAVPIASGMGSGAALATALVRALAAAAGQQPDAPTVAGLVAASERLLHGTPSGIDQTVIAREQPIWFCRASAPDAVPTIEPLSIARSFTLVIGDTGERSPTRQMVTAVRQRRVTEPALVDAAFAGIAAATVQARAALQAGDLALLGGCLDACHGALATIGVSCATLDRLVAAARAAGASGAKLAGAGGGGVMIALAAAPAAATVIAAALRRAGAAAVLVTQVPATTDIVG